MPSSIASDPMEGCMVRRGLLVCLRMTFSGAAPADQALRVLSFNIWGAGLHQGRTIADTVAVLRASGADIIGLQEVYRHRPAGPADARSPNPVSLACEIAREMGFHCHDQTGGPAVRGVDAVLSRFPITGATQSGLGVRIDLGRREATVFNLHLEPSPYQPYQLTGIAHHGAQVLTSEREAVDAATATRGQTISQLERDLAGLDGEPVFITGDFNEPSFRDWTARAAARGRHPLPVAWPATRRIEALGFTDTYRAAFPDEIARPGFTWTVLPDAREHHDRIDFIFARGPGLAVESAGVLGERAPEADLVLTPWPSDHRAVMASVRFASDAVRSAGR
jgi:exodeoxyribonuclease III